MEDTFTDFVVFCSYRVGHKGGGIAVFIKKCFMPFINHIVREESECLFFTIDKQIVPIDSDVIACFPYIPHESSIAYTGHVYKGIEQLENAFLDLSDKYGDLPWIVGGDFNARTGKGKDIIDDTNLNQFIDDFEDCTYLMGANHEIKKRLSKDQDYNYFGNQLLEFCRLYDLCILNGRKEGDEEGKITCIANEGRSVVDYIIASTILFQKIEFFRVIPRSESDHFPICLYFVNNTDSGGISETNHSINNWQDLERFNKLNWYKDKKETYTRGLVVTLTESKPYYTELLELEDVDTAICVLNSCITNAAPQKQSRPRNCAKPILQPKWFDSECLDAKSNKYRLLRKFHNSNLESDLASYINQRKYFKKLCKIKKKQFYKDQSQQLISQHLDNNPKGFWKMLRTMLSKEKTIQNILIEPHEWFTYFKTLLNPINGNCCRPINVSPCITIQQLPEINIEREYNSNITSSEVRIALSSLKEGKACGPDGIGPEFLMLEQEIFIEYLTSLFNVVFTSGKYPQEWSKSMLFPLHKKGNKDDVNNYRGINLLNVTSKVFSKILNRRLQKWCDQKNIIPEEQAGFRKSYSTIDNIFVLQSLIQKYLSKTRGRFYVFFVDFFKAFDWVDRAFLWNIVKQNDIDGKMLTILQNMYANVLISVKLMRSDCINHNSLDDSNGNNNQISSYITDYFQCMSGVKQGCILSPLLFSMFISEFVKDINQSGLCGVELLTNDAIIHCLLFADDLCLFSDSIFDMQKKMYILSEFCQKWNLKVNNNKSKMIVFRNGGYLKSAEKWFYDNVRVETVSYYNYLGMLFSSRLCWSSCLANYAVKASRVVIDVRRLFNRIQNVDRNIAFKIFDTKIKPILLYGSEIWGTTTHEVIENVQAKFCKAFLGIGKTTPNVVAIRELQRYPLFVDYKLRAIKYWCKLLVMNNDRFPRKCYIQQLKLCEMGRKNWGLGIKNLLNSLGFGYAWSMQEVGNVNFFLGMVKTRLQDQGYQIQNSSGFATNDSYSEVYTFDLPSYLRGIIPLNQRRLFTLLRTHSLPINKNLSRWKISAINVCQRCTQDSIDDEFHYLFECDKFAHLRQELIVPNFKLCTSKQQRLGDQYKSRLLIQLMNCSDVYKIDMIISFIRKTDIIVSRNDSL